MSNETLDERISVTGFAQLESAPDEARISFSVVTDSKKKSDAHRKNAETTSKVIDALEAYGVAKKDIETNYHLNQNWEWVDNKRVDKGFRALNTLEVKTRVLEQVGALIDLVENAGATNYNGTQYVLSPEAKEVAKKQLLALACKDAKTKAEFLAENLGAKVGRVLTIAESNYAVDNNGGGRRYMMAMAKGAETDSPETPALPSAVDTSANISVSFRIDYT